MKKQTTPRPTLTEEQFSARAELANIKPGTAMFRAARLVLVEGLSGYAAAAAAGCKHPPVYQTVKRCLAAPGEARERVKRLQELIRLAGRASGK